MVQVTVNVGSTYMKDLLARMRKAGISARQLSFEIPVDPSQFSRWARGVVRPRMDTVEAIEAALLRLQKKSARLSR